MNWIDGAGYFASTLVLAAFCMKTMVPLRVTAICSNIAFIMYAFYDGLFPVLILHLILLPLNILRTVQMLRLMKRVECTAKSDLPVKLLRPLMKETRRRAGDILFSHGDYADRLYIILAGEVCLNQIDYKLRAGDLFGEIGLFSADHRRTQTARALTDVELLWISGEELAQVCHENPRLAFYFLRLTTNRLIANGMGVSPIATAALNC
jgi:CRP/FNR family transcriptional regulator, cyclic AMP receptor protein